MKAVQFQATMGSISAKKDRSVGFRLNTPELTETEKIAIMELQPELLECTLKPMDYDVPSITVKAEKDERSTSERLRGAIYALYMHKKEAGEYVDEDFMPYYRRIMESFINKIKQELEQYD